jgi:hypothetical protein
MKDERGHGSDSQGGAGISHQSAVQRIGATLGAFAKDESGSGKTVGEAAFEKMHDPAMIANLVAELGSPELATVAHLAHLLI